MCIDKTNNILIFEVSSGTILKRVEELTYHV